MSVSPVDISNVALGMLGFKPITALTDPSRAAILCNALYSTLLDATLCATEWNFAQIRVKLSQLTDVPSFGFNFQYQLPVAPYCLHVNAVDPEDAVYKIETDATGTLRVLVTDEPEISIKYTARITDPALYSGSFILAFATHLSAEIALPLTEMPKVAEAQHAKYEAIISRAMTSDAQEDSTEIADINVLLDVRRFGAQAFDRSQGRAPSGFSVGFGVGGFGV